MRAAIIWLAFLVWAGAVLCVAPRSHPGGIAAAATGILVVLIAGNWWRRPSRRTT